MNLEPPADDAADLDDALNLTSMVDVVFILLAFFVLTARFVGPEQDLTADALADAPAAAPEDLPDLINIRLDADGAITLGTRPAADLLALTAALRDLAPADLPVHIDAAPTVPVESITATLDAVLQTHLTRVALVPPN